MNIKTDSVTQIHLLKLNAISLVVLSRKSAYWYESLHPVNLCQVEAVDTCLDLNFLQFLTCFIACA
jgi:hypothetical protein